MEDINQRINFSKTGRPLTNFNPQITCSSNQSLSKCNSSIIKIKIYKDHQPNFISNSSWPKSNICSRIKPPHNTSINNMAVVLISSISRIHPSSSNNRSLYTIQFKIFHFSWTKILHQIQILLRATKGVVQTLIPSHLTAIRGLIFHIEQMISCNTLVTLRCLIIWTLKHLRLNSARMKMNIIISIAISSILSKTSGEKETYTEQIFAITLRRINVPIRIIAPLHIIE